MILPVIYLFQICFILCAHSAESFEISDEVQKQLCAEDGKFRGEIIKCVEIMPLEMQITLKTCGAKYLNGTSCEYPKIISEMCDNPKYSQNVTNCIEEFKQSQHHDSSHEEEIGGHGQEYHHHHDHERHDNVEDDDDDDDESEEEIHVLHDLSILISKECMKNLFSLYNITLEEDKDED